MPNRLIVASTMLFSAAFFTGNAFPCSCGPITVLAARKHAGVVFQGTIVAIKEGPHGYPLAESR